MKSPLRLRRQVMSKIAALTLGAAFMLLPANLRPVMHIATVGSVPADMTIFAVVKALGESGLWYLAAIVFTASIVVPLVKIAGLAALLLAACGRLPRHLKRLARLHPFLETIRPWSMLDVFVVGFLSGAVRFGAFGSIEPRGGIVSFAVVVVLTLLATQAFDPRWLGNDFPPSKALVHENQAS